jgi:AcrR family transcriptional regulator
MTLATASTTRERLVAAAIEVFRRDGYERARVQDIAREAGLTTGAIYANYRGKAELLTEAIGQRTAHELGELLRSAGERSTVELLALLADRLLRRDGDRPLLLEAVVASVRDSELAATLRGGIGEREERFGALVERAKERGEIDESVDTETMARFCVMLAFGSMVLRTVDVDAGDRDAWHALIERLLGALAPQPGVTP